MPVDIAGLKRLYAALPETAEGTRYGTLAFSVRKRFLARLRDGDTVLAMRINPDERDFLLEIEPDVFFVTDHYRGHPYVLVRLDAVDVDRLAPLVERSWREQAPARLVAAFDRARAGADGG